MREDAMREVCFELASPEPAPWALSWLHRVDAGALEDFIEYADAQRVLLPISRWIMYDERLASRLAADHHLLVERTAALHAELRQYRRLSAETFYQNNLRVAYLKGLGTELAYCQGYQRQSFDIDLAVPDLDTFWKCALILMLKGFALHSISLRRDPVDDRIYGLGALTIPSQGDPGWRCKFDFQIGGQPLHWSTSFPFDDAFWSELTDTEEKSSIPSRRHAALIFLGEALERNRILVRDLLDFLMLIDRLPTKERAWLRERIEERALDATLYVFASGLRTLPVEASALVSLMDPSRAWLRYRPVRWPRPLRLALLHDLPHGIRHHNWPRAVSTTVRNAIREALNALGRTSRWRKPLATLSSHLDARRLFESGAYIQMILIDSKPTGSLEWSCRGTDQLLLTPLGVFLPLPLVAVNEAGLQRARAHALSLAS